MMDIEGEIKDTSLASKISTSQKVMKYLILQGSENPTAGQEDS